MIDSVSPVDAAQDVEGRAIDPQLLALIQRVAHREHLLADGGTSPRSTSSNRRRRPVTGSSARRTSRGTTARKVTWSR